MNVLVLENLKVKGVSTLDAPGSFLTCVSLKEALEKEWETDSFLVTYNAKERIPRLNRAILSSLPDDFLYSWGAVLDWDTPNHEPLTKDQIDSFFHKMPNIPVKPAYVWTSRRGMRALYIYDKHVSVLESEEIYRGLVDMWKQAGYKMDNTATLSRWNTLARLPRVMRDGTKTSEDPHFCLWETEHGVSDISQIKRIPANNTVVSFDGAKCPEDLSVPEEFRQAAVPLLRDALDGRMPDYLRGCSLTHHGDTSINNQIQRVMGSLARRLCNLKPNPEYLVGLIEDSIQASITRRIINQGRDLYQEAYKAACVNLQKEQIKNQEAEEERDELFINIQKGMDDPPLDYGEFQEWVQGKYILCYQSARYILQGDGTYSPHPVTNSNLIPAIKNSDISSLIDLQTDRGRWYRPDELIARHGYHIIKVQGEAALKGAVLRGDTLHVGLYHIREDLKPKFNPLVDQWLRYFFGKDYEKVANWIGCALILDRPICGLSVNGFPGIGKSMLIQGLAECINTEYWADDRVFDTQFNVGLEKSPFVCVNEGWKTTKGVIGKTFRELVGGDKVTINEKFKPAYSILVRPRIVITTNNLDAVSHLFSSETLTQSDKEAIADRILHVNTTRKASDWLEKRGGREFTSGWVEPESRYTVAEHFLWLHSQAKPEPRRFMVSGNRKDPVIQTMLSQMGHGPIVGHLLYHMVQNKRIYELSDGEYFAVASKCLQVYQEVFQNRYKKVFTPLKMKRSLSVWAKGPEKRKRVDGKQARGYIVDWALLRQFADSHGFEVTRNECSEQAGISPPT